MVRRHHAYVANQVFVGGTVGMSKQGLSEYFGVYGTIVAVRFAYDRVTRRRRGYGFIQFKHASSVQQALQLGTQHKIAGRVVTVQPARPPSHARLVHITSSKQVSQHDGLKHNQDRPCVEQPAHFRREQPQHTSSTTPPASLTLLELLHHVPMLSQLLTRDARKALSAANRSFRQYIVSKIQTVTVTCSDDIALIMKSAWPLLSMVIVQNPYAVWDASGRFLACVSVSEASSSIDSCAAILMLRPMHTFPSDSAVWPTLAAQQLASHINAKCPMLQSFELSGSSRVKVDLEALGVAVVAKFTKGRWSSLTSMSLHCGLDTQGISFLIQADWPVLKCLDLSGNRIDAEGMAILAKGNWPLLTHIVLSSNPSIDSMAIANLSAAKWPLKELQLDYMPITAAGATELAKLQLPNLGSISLVRAGLAAAAMFKLAQADWPRLSRLRLDNNDLDAAMQHLVRMQLPALKMLGLCQAKISQAGAHCLALGQWPLLTELHLSYNNLNAKGMEHIASGVWPNLKSLLLSGNPIGHGGAQQLIKGDWPLLCRLQIGLGMLEMRHSAACLGLDPDKVQGIKFDEHQAIVYLDRNVSQATVDLWPNLVEVMVVER